MIEPNLQERLTREAQGEALPVIETRGRHLRDVTTDTLSAIAAEGESPRLFRRSSGLARVIRDSEGRALIEPVGEDALRGHVGRLANFERDGRPVSPPRDVIRDLLSLGEWPGLPVLDGIAEVPMLRPDGSVLDQPGYDPATRVYLMTDAGYVPPTIPAEPTADQLRAALKLLLDPLTDFPFEDEASRANALALMLTPILRPAIEGRVPLALLDATKAGTGKGLLATVVSIIATGREASVMPAPTRADEWEKTLLPIIADGRPIALLDEVSELNSPHLAAALTASTYKTRRLGTSEHVEVPQRATWIAAGNNIRIRGDLARRCFPVRLDAKTARPWERTFDRDLTEWTLRHRHDLNTAALTVARAWFAAGKPAGDAPTIGGFQQWTDTLAGILTNAGQPGFLTNLPDLYENADDESREWEAWLRLIRNHYGDDTFTVGALGKQVEAGGPLADALPDDLAATPVEKSRAFQSKVGKALRAKRGTRYGSEGLHLTEAGKDSRSGSIQWKVEVAEVAEVAEVNRPSAIRNRVEMEGNTSGTFRTSAGEPDR